MPKRSKAQLEKGERSEHSHFRMTPSHLWQEPVSCPLYPRKRTCAVQLGMSALGQKQTSAGVLCGHERHAHASADTKKAKQPDYLADNSHLKLRYFTGNRSATVVRNCQSDAPLGRTAL
jgi:hypothetical protein